MFKLEICQHCSCKGKQEILTEAVVSEKIGEHPEIGDIESDTSYIIVDCKNCNQVSLYCYVVEFEAQVLMYPKELNNSFVPNVVNDAYREAKKVKHFSSTAFTVMIRRTLEFICRDKNVDGKNLYEKIQQLVDHGYVPEIIASMANNIRFLGNEAAHVSEIKYEEAEIVNELISTIIEYVYVLPGKIDRLDRLIQERKLVVNGANK